MSSSQNQKRYRTAASPAIANAFILNKTLGYDTSGSNSANQASSYGLFNLFKLGTQLTILKESTLDLKKTLHE